MININLHNYEEFYLDYIEGNLSAEHTAQLLLFLENNPDIKSELEGFEIIETKADPLEEIQKEPLKKYVDEESLDYYIIGSIEGVNDEYDELELLTYLQNSSQANHLFTRYQKTKLDPSHIKYPEKEKLKKRGAIIYYLYPSIAAAAALLIFFLIPNSSPVVVDENENNNIVENFDSTRDTLDVDKTSFTKTEIQASETDQKIVTVKINKKPDVNNIVNNKINKDEPNNHSMVIESKDSTIITNHEIVEQPKTRLNDTEAPLNNVANNDSTDIPNKIDKEVLASSDSPENKTKGSEVLTVGGWAKKMIRKKVFKKKNATADDITTDEIITAAATRVDNETAASANYSKDEKRSSFGFTIGKFEFYRSKSR